MSAATEPKVRVFAKFPREPQSSDWSWVHCLTFPVELLRSLRFSQKLYKWIRYAIGVVVGAQGDLSFSSNSPPNVVDYDVTLPLDSADLYYHISDGEMQRMFPADPDAGRSTVTSSVATSRRANFRSDLMERDGTCVLTDFEGEICDGVHLLPHSKGDEYIKTYTQKRGRNPGDNVNEIDSIRNGILLNKTARFTLGSSIAFLVTPNFAMSTADVDPSASTERRCTAHLFVPGKRRYFGDSAIDTGSSVRMCANDWPPGILFDAVYANAVLRHFSAQTLQGALGAWRTTFYPGGITNATQADHQDIIDQRAAQQEKKAEQDRARTVRRERRGALNDFDNYDLLLMLPYILMSQDQQEVIWREAEKKRAETERRKVEDKVVGWAKEVAAARCP